MKFISIHRSHVLLTKLPIRSKNHYTAACISHLHNNGNVQIIDRNEREISTERWTNVCLRMRAKQISKRLKQNLDHVHLS